MLNELYQVSQSLERVGITPRQRHQNIQPMAKNRELLVVCLNENAEPSNVEFVSGEVAGGLFRVNHPSPGTSFPGFNIPAPLLDLSVALADDLRPFLEQLCHLWKKQTPPTEQIHRTVAHLHGLCKAREFTDRQNQDFVRSNVTLVSGLRGKFAHAGPELTNFKRLLNVVEQAELDLKSFSERLTATLLHAARTASQKDLIAIQKILFGVIDWRNRNVELGTDEYKNEKAKKDKGLNQPVYLDVEDMDHNYKRVAHRDTSNAINSMLIQQQDSEAKTQVGEGELDAFGRRGSLQGKYPSPKIAKLGAVKLFSVNTTEVPALRRYGLKDSEQFPTSAELVQKMNDALLYLGDEKKREGVTWQGIPGNLVVKGKSKADLLIAYLEDAPGFQKELADAFGGETRKFGDSDFAARAQPVLNALEAKLTTDPSPKVRLLALCSLDKARQQVSLNRQFRVQDIVQASHAWKTGAANTPCVSGWFYERKAKSTVWKSEFVPHPLDLTSVINRLWETDPKKGFVSRFQRAVTTLDAYDVFFADGPISAGKTRSSLSLLLHRMSNVLADLGSVKNTGKWSHLGDDVRLQSRKAISLLGILLYQLEQKKDQYMKDSTYQVGRLLALADALHFQYCKWVRTSEEKRKKGKVEAPNELLGNSLFNFALDNPVSALARLAERIRPYKGWADTYSGDDAGLIHWFGRQIRDCERHVSVTELPERMEDIHKAQLLLGYLADNPNNETEREV